MLESKRQVGEPFKVGEFELSVELPEAGFRLGNGGVGFEGGL